MATTAPGSPPRWPARCSISATSRPPSASTAAPSSERVPTTPTTQRASTTWRSCCRPPTAWPRPSRCYRRGDWRSGEDDRTATAATPTVRHRLSTTWRSSMLRATNRLAEAEPLYRRALAIDEASYGPDHPDVATDLNNLAVLLRATNRLAEAEPLYRRALAIDEASVRPRPPRRRHRPQQPGGVAAGHQPPGRGRAAVPAGAGDRRGVVRPRPPRRRPRPQQPGGVAAGPPTAWPRPSRCSGGRWRSTRRRTAPTTPTSPRDLNNLAGLLAGHQPPGRGRAAVAGDALEILLQFTRATGHEHPHLRRPSTTTPGCSRRWAGASRRSRRGSRRWRGGSGFRW